MSRDWLIPFAAAIGLGILAMAVGTALGWSEGAIGTIAVGACVLGALLRLALHDYSTHQ